MPVQIRFSAQNGFCNIRVYYNFVKMCQEGKEKTISPEMINVLQEDNNYSLAQMGLKQHIKNRIIRLKDIFITAKVQFLTGCPWIPGSGCKINFS